MSVKFVADKGACFLALLAIGAIPLAGQESGSSGSAPPIEFGAVVKTRAESRMGESDLPRHADGYAMSRLRFSMTARPSDGLRIYVEAQDSQVGWMANAGRSRGLTNSVDLNQAYAEVSLGKGAATLTAGRMGLQFLGGRLIGRRNWHNIAPTWDGGMLTLERNGDSVHLMGFNRVVNTPGFDKPANTFLLAGVLGSVKSLADGHVLEPFVLTTRMRDMADLGRDAAIQTFGSRLMGEFAENWGYEVLLAAQRGGRPDLPRRGSLLHFNVNRGLPKVPWTPRLFLEWSRASGDDDPNDGMRTEFDPLYTNRHGLYGESDVTAMSNLKGLKAGVRLQPVGPLSIDIDVWDFRLATLNDGLYNIAARISVPAPTGGAKSDSIGQELDVIVSYALNNRIAIRLSASRFIAGPFVTDSPSGGKSSTFLSAQLEMRL